MQHFEVLQFDDAAFHDHLQCAIAALSSAHRWPGLRFVPVRQGRSRLEQGAYHYLSRPNRPVCIVISRHAVEPCWTLLHEAGHMVDHLLLNPIREKFGSQHDPMFESLYKAWMQSGSVLGLLHATTKATRKESPAAKRGLRYLLTPPELWARTYAQWIATRSNERRLISALASMRDECVMFAGIRVQLQWDHEAFKAIMEAVDDLMRNAGLI